MAISGPNGVHPPEPEPLSALDQLRRSARESFQKARTLLKAIRDPFPTQTGDGTYVAEPKRNNAIEDVADILSDIGRQDIKDVAGLVKTFERTALREPLNDREYLMESLVAVAAKMDDDFLQKKITDTFLTTLWNDLEHPPQTLLSDKFQFRQPDGSHNSYKFPDVGKAGMPYARTVPPKVQQSPCLPDPGVLFDSVMARNNPRGEKHPNRISSMLFYLASIIIHDIFRTDHDDFNQSNTSSYLDLAPLYGSNWEEQKRMRTFKDGKIKPDCFSESRLLTFPPGVGALLIMFNRYHNYVVEQLAAINENGRFTPRKPTVDRYGEKDLDRRDDDLFQTGRLVTCGLYVNIILIDYVRTILNINRTDSNWQLNPRADLGESGAPVGTGNQCSAEFNLVYRWHSAVSERDDRWTQQLFSELFPGVSAADVSKPEKIGMFLGRLKKLADETESTEPDERAYPALEHERLERIKEGPRKGSYRDDDLAAILTSSIEDCANAMGPQQVPVVMKAIEMLGIQQARTWKCATLNEFRRHFDLKPYETFEEITTNKDVSEALKHLYDTPEQVELYPGLVVEDAKDPKLPGSGLCPSFTTSRGVLSDAVALVRGDRFYTSDYTPALLTNWGYQEANFDTSIDNGCVFYKLFLRGLPHNYDPASVYVHYPMTIPSEMRTVLQDLSKAHLYNFDKPQPISQPTVIFSHAAAVQVIEDSETFQVTWGRAIEFLQGPKAKNSMLAGDGPEKNGSRKPMEGSMSLGASSLAMPTGDEKWLKAVRNFYEHKTTELLKQKSYQLAGVNYVDIVRDVGNLAHVHFCAEMFSIPLKTEKFPRGIFTEKQLELTMTAIYVCVFFDLDPTKSFPLMQKAREACQTLGQIMKAQVESIARIGRPAELLIEALNPTDGTLSEYGVHMIAQSCKETNDMDDVVWGNLMSTMGGMVAKQGQLFAQALDYFLTQGKEHVPEINRLAKEDSREADEILTHYLLEGARLGGGETGLLRQVTRDTTLTDTTDALGPRTLHFETGDTVLVNLLSASRDPLAFPNPTHLDLSRPLDSYLSFSGHDGLASPMTTTLVALTSMLKAVGRLDGLRPARVSGGESRVKQVVKSFAPGVLGGGEDDDDDASRRIPDEWCFSAFLTEEWDQFWPVPMSLKINWDG
ncbi:Psi-producing oxygenase A [Lecanosticta acicola]|uniref:Psi-producing oxygenase A n=1 Tax=Lecanosticta acicola TaxID=111012 RepID=A0AAI8YXN6_9PEZI|nr:Psi-producing oxygenase A [Lecanosticta acicola]